MKTVIVHLKIETWQEITLGIPKGMTAKAFIKHLKRNDPACNDQEPVYIKSFETETPLYAEYYIFTDREILVDTHLFDSQP